jgi:hypothetical protein
VTRSRAAAGFVATLVAGVAAAPGVATPFTHTIPAQEFAEECFKLSGGQSIGYAFESSAAVDFNIHFHRGNDVVYPAKADAVRRADERFIAPSTESYCLMWTNPTKESVKVTGRLSP